MLSSKCTCVQDLLLVFVNTKCFSDGVLAAFIYQDSSVLAQLGFPDMRLPTRIPFRSTLEFIPFIDYRSTSTHLIEDES